MYNKSALKRTKCTTKCTLGTTLEVTTASAWKAQIIGFQMYITLYICNVHGNVHWMYIVTLCW
jgi:hypothetical protein